MVEEERKKMSSPKELISDSQQSEKGSSGIDDLQDLDFTSKSRWTDLELKVEDKVLYLPKSHLALTSHVFQRMFESNFKEKNLDVLPLPGKKYEDVLTFLKCTHPGVRLKITYDIIPKVLPQAHEYQVKWLLDDCTNIMLDEINASRVKSGCNITDILKKVCNIGIMAEKYGLSSVIEKFIERCSSVNYKLYRDLSEFKEISSEIRYRILWRRLDSTEKDV